MFLVIIMIIIIAGSVGFVDNIVDNYKYEKAYNECEIIYGDEDISYNFATKAQLYCYKDGESTEIEGLKKDPDYSNFYKIMGNDNYTVYLKKRDEILEYYSYNTKNLYGIIKEEYLDEVLNEYEKYDEKDKENFSKMISLVKEECNINKKDYTYRYEAMYFFIKNNNYYMFIWTDDGKFIYKYNSSENKVDNIIKIKYNLHYFA